MKQKLALDKNMYTSLYFYEHLYMYVKMKMCQIFKFKRPELYEIENSRFCIKRKSDVYIKILGIPRTSAKKCSVSA